MTVRDGADSGLIQNDIQLMKTTIIAGKKIWII